VLSTTDRDGQGTIAKAALCRNSDWPAKTSQQSSCRAKFGTAWSSRSFYRLYIACTSRHDRLAVIHVIHFFCLTASSGRGHSFLYHQGLRHQGCCQTRPLPLFVFVQLSEENGLLGSNTLFITCHDGPCAPLLTSLRDRFFGLSKPLALVPLPQTKVLDFVKDMAKRRHCNPYICRTRHTSSLASTSCRVSSHKEGNTEMKSGGRIRNWPRYQRVVGKRGVMQIISDSVAVA